MSYLLFQEGFPSESGKTKTWNVFPLCRGNQIGKVSWYGPWRKYTAELFGIFDHSCLREIADFCEEKTREHKLKS